MQTLINIFNFTVLNFQAILTSVIGILTGLIGIFMFIPGEQPEKALQSVVDFLAKFSKK